MSTVHRHRRLILSALLLCTSLSVHAQINVETSVLATGGASAANATMRLTGTFGQPIIGTAAIHRKLLLQGFWFAAESNTLSVTEPVAGETTLQLRCIPNPVSKAATAHAFLPIAEETTLTLHDLLGRRVQTIADAPLKAGSVTLEFNTEELAEGDYRLILTAGKDRISLPVRIVR